jgi:Uma2 family endonuclease
MVLAAALAERVRPILRIEYDRMVDLGLFDDERVELWQGVILRMSPQKSPHAAAVMRLTRLLVLSFADGRAEVRVQLPLALSEDSEPEPDLAVVAPGEYKDAHPSTALLVIEVADSSVEGDREFKATGFATAGVPEYWIVNLRDDAVEVHLDPSGGHYRRIVSWRRGQTLQPQAFPDLRLSVDQMLG